MCFSSTASFTAAAVLGGAGAATLALVRTPEERLFAALPLGFAAHQLLEGLIWLQVEHSSAVSMRSGTVVSWLFYAWFLLPVWIPVAVLRLEPDPARRAWLRRLVALGLVTGTTLFAAALVLPAGVAVTDRHLEYQLPVHPGWVLVVPYLVATCLPLLLCSRAYVQRFGLAMIGSVTVSAVIAAKELSSVWCFFAAVLSLGLVVHFALDRRRLLLGGAVGAAVRSA